MSDNGPKQDVGEATPEQPEAADLNVSNSPANDDLAPDLNTSTSLEQAPELDLSLANLSNDFGEALETAKVNSYQDLRAFAMRQDNDLELNTEQLEFLRDIMEPVTTGVYEGIHEALEARLANVPESELAAAKAFAYEAMTLVVSKLVTDNAMGNIKDSLSAVAERVGLQTGSDSSDLRVSPKANALYWDAKHEGSAQSLGMAA